MNSLRNISIIQNDSDSHSQFGSKQPAPIPLSFTLPVKPYTPDLIPEVLNNWILDVSERTGFPPDFMCAAMLTSISSIVSDKLKICPKQHDDSWVITPNLWGALIGEPSTGKSPMLKQGLEPIVQIEQGNPGTRLIARDTTVEKLGEILNETGRGILVYRDELDGWLSSLSKTGRETDRAFYLESFNGSSQYSFDRIGRGSIHINSLNISILGGIQPARIDQYIQDTIKHKSGDDGLLQRFQIAVWPDIPKNYSLVDRKPDLIAKNLANKKILSLFKKTKQFKDPKVIKFSEEAQVLFNEFVLKNREKIHSEQLHSSFKAHLAKYERLVPSLALIYECLISNSINSVNISSIKSALTMVEYLESHANKIYSFNKNPDIENAQLILDRKDKLPDLFKLRDIQQRGWIGLSDSKT